VNGISEIAFSAEHIELAASEANEEKETFRAEQKLTTADLDEKIKSKRSILDERIDSLEKEMALEMKAAEELKSMLEEEKGGVELMEKAASKDRIFATVVFTSLLIVALIVLMRKLIITPLSKFREPFMKIAEGDLTQRLDETRGDELGDVARWFNSFMVMLNDAMGKMAKASTTVSDSSKEISQNSGEVAKSVQNQVVQTDHMARAISEISAAVEDVSANATSESALAEKAMDVTRKGENTIVNAIEGMGKIEKTVKESANVIDKLGGSSEKIGEVIEVINDIADQTNLLALNAAIEAARAGEHGRGFAVVADEVRKLAERTTRATGEVAKTIEEIQENTRTAVISMEAGTDEVTKGASLINEAGVSFKEIVDIITQLAGKANEIAASVEQQAATTRQVSENTEVVTKSANDVAAGTEVTSNSAKNLSELADELNELVGKFKL
jgi:methyl-accepting chemotaxis protein